MQTPHAVIEYGRLKAVTNELAECARRFEDFNAKVLSIEHYSPLLSELQLFAPADSCLTITGFRDWEVVIHLVSPGFTSEAAPRLTQYLEWLSEYLNREPYSEDHPAKGERWYIFPADEPSDQAQVRLPNVKLVVELLAGSDACQRIVVGTRQTQQVIFAEISEPVYAFKC